MNIEGTAKLLDYGIVVDDDATVSYWVVMPEYGASMRSWRESAFNMKNVADFVPLFLMQFSYLCDTVSRIHDAGICHRDIRCDNVFLEKRSSSMELTNL